MNSYEVEVIGRYYAIRQYSIEAPSGTEAQEAARERFRAETLLHEDFYLEDTEERLVGGKGQS